MNTLNGFHLLAAFGVATLVGLAVANWRQHRQAWRRWNHAPANVVARKPPPVSAALVLAQVSARLRAGASAEAAWDEALSPLAPRAPTGVDNHGVPTALAHIPQLQPVAGAITAACHLTHHLGVALADILDAILLGVEDAEAAAQEQAVARAGPQLTARLLTALPAAGVVTALALGAPLWQYATDLGAGSAVTALGVALWSLGHAWSATLIRRSQGGEGVDRVVLAELVAAALAAGSSIPRAISAVGRAAGVAGLESSAKLLQLGADLEACTQHLRGPYRALVHALGPAWFHGAAPLPLLELLAQRWRRERAGLAREAAQRLAVKLVLPLGLCLLPAFICLGVVPVVVTLLV